MGLIFNLPGAAQTVRTAGTNKERIEATNRLAEEFYRTIGVLCYTRLLAKTGDEAKDLDPDLKTLIRDFLRSPTLESWIRLGRLSGDSLREKGDPFALQLAHDSATELTRDEAQRGREIIVQIHKLRGSEVDAPKRVSFAQVLEVIRLLRNFRSHEWDSNEILRPVIEAGTPEFILNAITSVLSGIDVEILCPVAIRKDSIEVLRVHGTEFLRQHLPWREEDMPLIGQCYISFGSAEPLFLYPTSLLRIHEDQNRVYVYLKTADSGTQFFEAVPVVGPIHKVSQEGKTFESLFGLPPGGLDSVSAEETLTQQFGKLTVENGTIHNLPEITRGYVSRPAMEAELTEKLNHRRLYLTTLDGGGGFGKTELAKKVVRDLIQNPGSDGHALKFQYVVWVTGKSEFFETSRDGSDKPSLRSLEDLLNSILYVSGSTHLSRLPVEERKREVLRILNTSTSTLILLDNLETVGDRDQIWAYLVELGNSVTTEFKVLATSRVKGGASEQRMSLRPMEPSEAETFTLNEMSRLGVRREWGSPESIQEICVVSGRIPLLIRYSVGLLAKGYTLDEMIRNAPRDTTRALEFMCGLQWNRLKDDSKRLLTAVAFRGGRASFAEARILCNLDEKEFESAREELQENSFLTEETLIESVLAILSPVNKFARLKLREKLRWEKEFREAMQIIASKQKALAPGSVAAMELVEEIALNRIFQDAILLQGSGDIKGAYEAYKNGTERYPNNVKAWRLRGDFEYRYLGADQDGQSSFAHALDIDPKDAEVYSTWAYWEFERGAKVGDRAHLKASVELNRKVLIHSRKLEVTRSAKLYVAKSLLKLTQLARTELLRQKSPDAKKVLREEIDQYAEQVLEVLSDAEIAKPTNVGEIRHNITVHSLSASAYLARDAPLGIARLRFDLLALLHLIRQVKEAPWEPQLPIGLENSRISELLRDFGISIQGGSRAAPRIIELEPRVIARLDSLPRGST